MDKGDYLRRLGQCSTPEELHVTAWSRCQDPGNSVLVLAPDSLCPELYKDDLYEVLGRFSYDVLAYWYDLRAPDTGEFLKGKKLMRLGLRGNLTPWEAALDLALPVLIDRGGMSILVPPDLSPSRSFGPLPWATTEAFGVLLGGGGLDPPERRCVDYGPTIPEFPKYCNAPRRLCIKGVPLPLPRNL